MTNEELAAVQAAITTGETEKAALDQARRDSIDKAREYNAQSRDCTSKITALDKQLQQLRVKLNEHNAEVAKARAEAMRKEAEEKAKARAEAERLAAEAKAKEESELTAAKAKIAELEGQLAAKG